MKITFLVSGNVESNFTYRALALAKALHHLGHDVSMIAPRADKYNNFEPKVIHSIAGVRILQPFQFATRRLEINLLPYIFSAAKMVLRTKSDLIYIYKPTPISIVGFLAKFFRGTPVILDMDDLGSEVMRIEGHPWHQRVLTAWCEHFAEKHADRIVVASTYLFDKYRKEFPGKPLHLMPNGVEGDWFLPLLPSQKKNRLVFMGAINRKNILDPLFDALPDVLKKYNNAEVIIIGDGQFLSYFKERAEKSSIDKWLTFTGWLTLDKARAHFFAGDLGYSVMPDNPVTRAANNMKVSQYMSRGVVPVVSDIGDLPATVDFGKAGYICKPDDVESLKEVLLNALYDNDRQGKADHARNFALEKFSWENLAMAFNEWLTPGKHGGQKKIYVVATTVPDNSGGGEIRNYNIIKQFLKKTDFKVEVFCISPIDTELAQKKFESEVAARCHIVSAHPRSAMMIAKALFLKRVPPYFEIFKSSGIGDMFRKACEISLPDVVHIEQLHAYYCIRPHIPWLKSNGVKIVFDCHNIEYLSFNDVLEISSLPKKIAGKLLVSTMKKMEIEATQYADMVFVCSPSDAIFFKGYNPKTYVVPNGVDCSQFQPTHKNQNLFPNTIFMGGVKYPPNGDAMQFYLEAIHPTVKKQMPNVKLLAIGTDKEWLNSIGVDDGSIKPLGFVEDVRPYLEKATVGICPIRYGSGTRIKIMTYMAAGLPVVSTSKGAEGVTYTNGHDIIIADDPEEFAEAILKLLSNKTYREEIARNGHDFIFQNYDWDVIGKDLVYLYQHELS